MAVIYSGCWSDVILSERVDSSSLHGIKMIPLGRKRNSKMAEREMWFQMTRSSPAKSIVSFVDWFIDLSPPTSLCVVMDYYSLTLAEFISRVTFHRRGVISDIEVSYISSQMSQALCYLESVCVVHRDIHSGNILWRLCGEVSEWKLSDFGSCSTVADQATSRFRGNILTAAPELLRENTPVINSDVWSLGCILWECLTLAHPFSLSSLLSFAASDESQAAFTYLPVIPYRIRNSLSPFAKDTIRIIREKLLVPCIHRRIIASKLQLPNPSNYQMKDGVTALEISKDQ